MGRRWFALALLLVAGFLAVRPNDPDAAGADRRTDDTLERLKVFFAAVERIQDEYVDTTALDPPDTLVRGAIEGMIRELDPYSHYLPATSLRDLQQETQGEFGGIGIMIGIERNRLTVIAPLEGTPADRMGIRTGDVVVEIDGESTEGLSLEDAVGKLRGTVGTKVAIRIERGGEILPPVTITRGTIPHHSVKWTVLSDSIAVIRIGQFTGQTGDELDEALRAIAASGAVRGLVLDLRGNPGGLLQGAVAVTDRFIDTGPVVSTRGRTPEQNHMYEATARPTAFRAPIVVLVDKGSASASEIVSGALQDTRRAFLVGMKTFGKGSVQSVRQLPDGSGLALTTALYFTPAGRKIHGIGLDPDVVVEGRPAPEGKELEALQSDAFRDLLNEFAQGRRSLSEAELRAFGVKVRGASLEITDDLLEFLVLREMTRRNDRGLFLKPALDPQLSVALQILRGDTVVPPPRPAAPAGSTPSI